MNWYKKAKIASGEKNVTTIDPPIYPVGNIRWFKKKKDKEKSKKIKPWYMQKEEGTSDIVKKCPACHMETNLMDWAKENAAEWSLGLALPFCDTCTRRLYKSRDEISESVSVVLDKISEEALTE